MSSKRADIFDDIEKRSFGTISTLGHSKIVIGKV